MTREEIVRRMSAIRTQLDGEVGGIVFNARRLADWHYYVRAFPWLSTLAASAVGFLVVPRKAAEAPTIPEPKTVVEKVAAKFAPKPTAPAAKAGAAGGIVGSLVGVASSFALKMALQYAGENFKHLWAPRAAEDASTTTPRQTVPS